MLVREAGSRLYVPLEETLPSMEDNTLPFSGFCALASYEFVSFGQWFFNFPNVPHVHNDNGLLPRIAGATAIVMSIRVKGSRYSGSPLSPQPVNRLAVAASTEDPQIIHRLIKSERLRV